MGGEPRIGVYICHCGSNIAGMVDVEQVARFAGSLDSVVVARSYRFMCSGPGQNLIKQDIQQLNLNRIVVAACSPTMHEPTFRHVCQQSSLNPYLFQMANIREHCSWVTEDKQLATEKAKALVSAAVRRVYYQESLEIKEVPMNPNTLVVGGGIAGIQAALEIADSEHKVYLVERNPSIGGHMIQFDKTFPTLDCSACILTPKMTQAGSHPFIELMTYSEVEEISGFIGNFKAKIRERARYVDINKCTCCTDCSTVCPVELPSEFDLGMARRKAVYRPFPQAVPSTFSIDRQGYPPCRVACPAGVNVQGYISLIAQGKFKEAIAVLRRTMPFPGVCGRACTHPCEVDCERGKVDQPLAICSLKRFMADYEFKTGREKAAPIEKIKEEKIAIIGAGPAGLACAYDLIKSGHPVTVFEAASQAGGLLRYGIPEYRLPREVIDSEISYIEELGVEIKTNTPVKNLEDVFNQGYQAIFLGTGAGISRKMAIPGENSAGVIHAINFLRQINLGAKVELGQRVAIVGGGNAAVDAARVARRLGAKEVSIIYRRSRDEMPAVASEVEEAEREGVQINFLTMPLSVLSEGDQLTGIRCIRMELGEADASGRRRPIAVKGSEFNMDIDNLIIAIGQAVDKTMLSGKLEYTDRGTLSVDPLTRQTNIKGVFAGGDVAAGSADIIDAIAAGKEAAISIERYLEGADLKEGRPIPVKQAKDVSIKGVEIKARGAMPILQPEQRQGFAEVEIGFDEKMAIEEAKRCLNCGGCSECLECVKACQPKAIVFEQEDKLTEVEIGSIIVATGLDLFDPTPISQYGYHRLDNVITSLEFERLVNSTGPTNGDIVLKDGSVPRSIAIIHCVGSRDKNYHAYCSRVCCMYSLKFAHLIKEKINAEVYQMYIDMRCFGKGHEEFYERISEEGVNFIRGKVAEITENTANEGEGNLVVSCEDTLLGNILKVPVDMVILSVALEMPPDSDKVARLFNISRGADGFFLEKHPKLDPVATTTDGIFVVGCCQGPKDIPDTVVQASAAAARVLAMISKGRVEIEAATVVIDERICSGCQICKLICPYNAISFEEEQQVCRVNEALCKGCGACVGGCLSDAISLSHFTNQQILAEMEGALI